MEPLDQAWFKSKKEEGKSSAWVIGYVLETVDYFPRIEVDPNLESWAYRYRELVSLEPFAEFQDALAGRDAARVEGKKKHRARSNPMRPGWETVMSLRDVLAFKPLMESYGVSEVARSPRGFLTAFEKAGGNLSRMGRDPKFGQDWQSRRENFIARHMGQITKRGEPLWDGGEPSRRHLALIAWAYTPDPQGVARWLSKHT